MTEIRPNPPIADSERWKTENGPEYYPYVRTIGGVSLFDFDGFEDCTYREAHPASSWWTFVPVRDGWETAIWLKLDRKLIENSFVSGQELVNRWNAERAHRHAIMPFIEAAHIGPIPVAAICRVLEFNARNECFVELEEP